MTKKHYEAIAAILSTWMKAGERTDVVSAIAYELAVYFAQENPRFLQDKFLKACGVESDTYICCSVRGCHNPCATDTEYCAQHY